MTNLSARKLGSLVGAAVLSMGLSGCPHRIVDTSWIKPGVPSCHISVEEDGSFSQTKPLLPDVKLTVDTAGFSKQAKLSYVWKSAQNLGAFKGTGRKVVFDITGIRPHTVDVSVDVTSSDGQSAHCFNGVVTNGRGTP